MPDAADPLALAGSWLDASIANLAALVAAGGPVVVALLCLSVLALAIVLLKLWQVIRLALAGRGRAERAAALWLASDRTAALALVAGHTAPLSRVLAAAMRALDHSGMTQALVREEVERVALGEIAGLRAYLRGLEATVQIAPLLGLFGTVIGMIDAFRALEAAGADADPAVLAGGIWVALLTTAVGLSVAIPTSLFLYWFEGVAERQRLAMEDVLTGLFTRRIGDADAVQLNRDTSAEAAGHAH